MTLILTILQVLLSLVVGLYFFRQLRKDRAARPGGGRQADIEGEHVRRLRSICLSQPLNEAVRPRALHEIVGQEEGVRALKAVLCGENPQHVIIYGPPGVGKTCAARLALEAAKRSEGTPFRMDAPFVEMDATCLRFDERAIADPLFGSVHDPIYQGAGPLGQNGVPQPREGAVTRAHGGVLFLDEIGEMHPVQMNKLLKVLEDRLVRFDSAYYDPADARTPAYIHDIFQNGLPADFRLVGATTRSPADLPPALRSRCMEIFFRPLEREELAVVAENAARRAGFSLSREDAALTAAYADSARTAVNLVQLAAAAARQEKRSAITRADVEYVAACSRRTLLREERPVQAGVPGQVNALAVGGADTGSILRAEAAARAGAGRLRVTGIVDQEEVCDGRGRTLRRTGSARDSAEAARTALAALGVPVERFDLHVHFPGGAIVDGPSAGLAMAAAMESAISGAPVAADAAMTGEISVHGDILPVGGVRAKVRAARRAGLRRVLVPWDNRAEAECAGIEIVPVRTLREALAHLNAETARPLPAACGDGLLAAAPERGSANLTNNA
ncbi:MAG TPA: AAA family ATPase [Candidatus Pullichristensenella avicola]|nr:AAA family ATPase [Candidatus Pullichristensenella avicola]